MQRNQWDNITNRDSKDKSSQNSFGLSTNKTAFFSIKAHTVNYGDPHNNDHTFTYIVCSTYDAEVTVLENQNPFGKYTGNYVDFKEKIRIRAHLPIADSLLQIQHDSIKSKHYLLAYFIDIYSNIYLVNLTNYFEWNPKVTMPLQPIKFKVVFYNMYPTRPQDLYYEQPLLLYKRQNLLTTINLAGTLRIIDEAQDNSWINSIKEPKLHQFKDLCLCAASSQHKSHSSQDIIVLVFKNQQLPYPFLYWESEKDFKDQAQLINRYYSRWKETTSEIIACEHDPNTNLVVTGLATQEIELYELKKHKDTEKNKIFYACQTIYRFFPISSVMDKINHIEYINANRGFLAITTCREYIIFSLEDKTIKKRGKGSGNTKNSPVEKLKWLCITQKDKSTINFLIAKGYNHHNQDQSRVGKPNMHFKSLDLARLNGR